MCVPIALSSPVTRAGTKGTFAARVEPEAEAAGAGAGDPGVAASGATKSGGATATGVSGAAGEGVSSLQLVVASAVTRAIAVRKRVMAAASYSVEV
jgi:hypothetical protein